MQDRETNLQLTHAVRPAVVKGRTQEAGDPALLLLHGRGADEMDLMGLAGALDPRLTVVSARAPFRFGPGFAWYDISPQGAQDDETLGASLEVLRQFSREICPAYNLDPALLYVMGFSQGAVMSACLALTMPSLRGVIMHSGYLPSIEAANGSLDLLPGKPFFVAHGRYDEMIPVESGRQAAGFLEAHGAKVTYREYPIGHSISEESLYELSEWLTEELDRAESSPGRNAV
jgi:phospholipase/carboxylesterase